MVWYENKKLIEKQFLRVLREGTGCDPFNGGCLIVAQAIQSVVGGELGVLFNDENEALHAVVLRDGVLWDFDGPMELQPFLSRYNTFVEEEKYEVRGYRKREGWDLSEASENDVLAGQLAKLIEQIIPENMIVPNGKIRPVKWPPIFENTRYQSKGILWHGTPNLDFKPQDIRPGCSFINGVFLTGSPEVAAFYAGEHGVVHGFELRPSASLLNAATDLRHRDWRLFDYPSEDEWRFVKDFLYQACSIEVDPATFRMLDPGKAGLTAPPLGLEGQLSWSALLWELSEVPDDAEALLKEMGYDGVTRCERVSWALSDRAAHLSRLSTPYGRLCSKLEAGSELEHFVVAVRNPDALVHSVSVSAEEFTNDIECGRGPSVVYEDDLTDFCKRPTIASVGALAL
jgi:hypothetical protein